MFAAAARELARVIARNPQLLAAVTGVALVVYVYERGYANGYAAGRAST